ncbi:LAFE_0G09032g1_1 [Lachancea fermentati]|uniref:Ribosome biogenesis protein NOP53 n=1 Tax=Lachancea fermentati TaxID=4955 RepID=A0A1G4MHZ3_LACFM|nr:LAFE_0G09032g1_1 [Lachancea fermentati]
MASNGRPSTYKQSSRKGKKSWRKNIDLSDIEQAITRKHEEEITHGTSDLTSLVDDKLFQVDTEGDAELKSKLIKRKQIKKNLKSSEILEAVRTNSKVAALKHPKSSSKNDQYKVQGVSKKELKRLMALAGKIDGESKLKTSVAKDGIVKAASSDLWGSSEEIKTPSGLKLNAKTRESVPTELLKQSITGWSVATVAPETMNRAPVVVKEIEKTPHAGKSYNPSASDWSHLVSKEYDEEKVKEENRIKMEQYKDRIQHLIETLDNNEEDSSGSSDDDSEQEDDDEDEEEIKLSINRPVENKKKTKYQRNKQRRHLEKIALQEELKKLRKQVHELEKLEEIEKTVTGNHEAKHEKKKVSKERANKKHKLGTKHAVIDETLEVKFSDELSDSLRKLRPEGNLLYDSVRNLQGSGKIEARVPVRKGRRYKPKVTEKWTYKDYK